MVGMFEEQGGGQWQWSRASSGKSGWRGEIKEAGSGLGMYGLADYAKDFGFYSKCAFGRLWGQSDMIRVTGSLRPLCWEETKRDQGQKQGTLSGGCCNDSAAESNGMARSWGSRGVRSADSRSILKAEPTGTTGRPFISALFVIAKVWKQPEHSAVGD